jgi:hypothetical protein
MLAIYQPNSPQPGISRRAALQIGALGFTGLLWSDLLAKHSAAGQVGPGSSELAATFGKAKSCILIFNYGGPSHLDTWDLKPDVPAEIRGEFQPMPTNVSGIFISEHLPQLARRADRYAIIRSACHDDNDHAVGTYLALTGHPHPQSRPLGIEPAASALDMPSLGSVVSKLRPSQRPIFPYVTLGILQHLGNKDSMGQNGACLGKTYDPFCVPSGAQGTQDVRAVLTAESGERLGGRRNLLEQMNVSGPPLRIAGGPLSWDSYTRRAHELLSSSLSKDAFDLEREPQKVRDQYGPIPFAQNCLLARRLVEAGVPLVTVYSVGNRDWDTHGDNFKTLKNTLLPPMDQGVSALLEDLDQRGLLSETLVVWMGDMGRTPLINKAAGRDHWSYCYSVVMAGAGIRGGQVYGSSDRRAAYPAANPVSPQDIAATIYHSLGIDLGTHLLDQQGRPLTLTTGAPIERLFA